MADKEEKKGFFHKDRVAERRANRQERRKKRRLKFQAKRAERIAKKKNIIPATGNFEKGTSKHKFKENEDGTKISYKTTGSDEKQAIHETKDGETKIKQDETKGGNYTYYGKESEKAGSFRDAFATASKAGKDTFMWNGLKYSTKKK